MWTQNTDPMGALWLSALVAALPIVFLFLALAVFRVKGHWAALGALAIAWLVAVVAFRMPASLACMAAVNGACFGLFPIGWIIFCAVFMHSITTHTGQFEALKTSIASLTGDRCTQGILVAFSFGALIEACAGFGAPVAISAGILAGLGFPLLEAAQICLIANTAPVAFGSIGIPIVTAGQISGVDQMAISQMVGRQLPVVAFIVPFYLVAILGGWDGVRRTWLPALAGGASFAVTQWWTANYLGPALPDILAAIASIAAMGIVLTFQNRRQHGGTPGAHSSRGNFLFGWSPYIVICIVMIVWSIPAVKAMFDKAMISIYVPLLHEGVTQDGKALSAIYKFNWLSASGTALLISALVVALGQGIPPRVLLGFLRETFVKLRLALVTVAALLGYAYLSNFSGMAVSLGLFIAGTGALFPLFAPVIGWLGVFITGSDTSSNAIFGKLQAVTADKLGISPVLTVAANASGGVAGKMVSPQSIAVATAATGMTGQEAALFRKTIKHSLLLLAVIMAITYAQATIFQFMIPMEHAPETKTAAAAAPSIALPLMYVAAAVFVSTVLAFVAKPVRASGGTPTA
jgi:lactate permease